ncbi:MAG: hypothetical protein ACJ74W_02530 [Pyrinomonadaceae bacterium]
MIKPEAAFVVTITETGVSCARASGLVESVAWADLQEVSIITNDEGPFALDVMWLLVGAKGGCVVPQGATGEDQLLTKLQSLPGFNNEAVIEAMSSVENRKFVCWEKK